MLWLLIVGFLVIIYLPFAMRSWRAFLTLCLAYVTIGISVQLGITIYSAADIPRFLVLAGNTWIDYVVKILPVTVIARAVVLTLKSQGVSGRHLIVANILGILALPVGIAGIVANEKWQRRSAPLECTSKSIPLNLLGFTASAPWNQGISLYLGDNVRSDGRYIGSSRSQRRLCRETSNGTKSLTVEAISLRVRGFSFNRCTVEGITLWEKTVCENWDNSDRRYAQDKVVIFNPDGIRLGDFGIPKNLTNDNFQVKENEKLISVTRENLESFTAVCRGLTNSDRLLYCRMHRPIVEGINLYWATSAPSGNIEDYLRRTDEFALKACLSTFGQSLCETPIVKP